MKTVTVESGGRQRTYLLYVPPGDGTNHPLPLVLVFHGAGDTAAHTVDETDLPNIAQHSHNMILVFPQGYENSWNEGTGGTPAAQAKVNDVAFVAMILRRVEAHYAVDRRRVVATGFSNGALLTEDLGCALSSQLTMIAPVEGELPQTIAAKCRPAAPLSVLEVHGTADSAIPYTGGGFTGVGGVPGPRVLSAPNSAERWAALDRCPGKPNSKTTGQVTFATYGSCEDRVTVTLATVNGGQHAWPSGFGPTLAKAISTMSTGRTATP
jgi:polyhydroxybutyrate depolymerase